MLYEQSNYLVQVNSVVGWLAEAHMKAHLFDHIQPLTAIGKRIHQDTPGIGSGCIASGYNKSTF